ncbi:MAG: flagellar hook-basal body complex protein FliE [Oscillospiraceae bacterium]|nr:flagellar hook-basal body complex protein FliE [Oscillospiraceae bacterium]
MSSNSINPLASNLVNLLSSEALKSNKSDELTELTDSFANILNESLKTASDADTTDKLSALDLLTGQSDDMSGLLLDAQKAELSLNLALQIRNKVIDAYNEIMRMQV